MGFHCSPKWLQNQSPPNFLGRRGVLRGGGGGEAWPQNPLVINASWYLPFNHASFVRWLLGPLRDVSLNKWPKLYYKVSFCCSCDCYLLKDILQNWSDEDAALILDNLFKAMKPGSRLLLIEAVLHTGSHSEERVGCTLTFRNTVLM